MSVSVSPTLPDAGVGYTARMPVHFDDLDAMGIVHNARYAILLERSLTRFWESRGVSYQDGRPTTTDVFNAVREFSITYHQPIRGMGEVAVQLWLERMGASSAVYGFAFRSPDQSTVYATGRRVNIKLDPATMRPAPWTEEARGFAAELLLP